MKPFNIELAKKNHPVQTRDGRSVRILCYDRKHDDYPIVALVENPDFGDEDTEEFTISGKYDTYVLRSEKDLFMAPTKKEGWINIYPSKPLETLRRQVSEIYSSKEEALKYKVTGCIATTKIEWEE